MRLYAEWKDAWNNSDLDGLLKLYSPQVQFRRSFGSYVHGYTGIKFSTELIPPVNPRDKRSEQPMKATRSPALDVLELCSCCHVAVAERRCC
jgi:hypothetical protein